MSRILLFIPTSWVAGILLMAHLPAGAQENRAQAFIDTTRMLIGDHVNIWLQLEHAPGRVFSFPAIPDSIAGKIEVLESTQADTFQRSDILLKIRQRILVTSFDTGFYVIPSFYFIDPLTGDSLRSNALPLEVLGIEIDTTKGIADIKLPYDVPLGWRDIWPYLLAGVLIASALALFFVWRSKRKKPEVQVRKYIPPPVPAHVWALGELDRLSGERLWQQGKTKLYYSRITDIIRRYLELRYQVHALEQTTFDIIHDLRNLGMPSHELTDELNSFLSDADLVKFAKWIPEAADNERSQQLAYDFVLKTQEKVDLRTPEEQS